MALATHQVQGSYAPSSLSWKKGIKLKQNCTSFCKFPRTDINRVDPSRIHGSKRSSVKLSNFSSNGGLTSLPTASPNQDLTLEVPPSNEKCGILKTLWCKFFSLDAKVKIPAIIFIPMFLVVNIIYGAHVAKELTPLWIGGPLLVALYMKMLHVICSLYVFSYKQLVKVVKNFTYGKESIRDHLWQHVVYFRNLDYKYESERIWEDFKIWLGDTCLDHVESMWSYRKTVGFLKMAKIM
ncbi:hypothetical protein L2E82_27333 [Cichorium intybus]|uniref:Uncharacterized protein n=1 Tax=Cichorium intybus TaxID=13427 RepID=A0ACB9CSV2_CICIN|nr:hypothetical protein L2E82_27333 [Cichorium intybus]